MSAALIAGRYRVEQSLGRGGVGEVLRVLDVERGQRLALKRLPALALPQVHTQFELEFRTLASLRHPRIVQAHEYGRDPEGVFYTMELLSGDDLARRTPLPWREVCALVRDAAEGLAVLHARGLVHRDVSVRNLWRAPDGRVKLIDFGAVAPFGPPPNLAGTPPCVPPEALERLPLDARADLYALGAVAYYLLTGLNAFPARAIAQLPELWQHEPLPPSHAIAELGRTDLPAIPQELDALVAALLSRSALGRPASTAQLLDRLDHLLGESGSSPSHEQAEAQLAHPAFVGRARARRRLRRLFLLASRGRGCSVVVEGEPGQGRTRLLRELALELGTTTATVVYVDAATQQGSFSTATALAGQLLEVQPAAARAALRPHASALAQVSVRLRERLGLSMPRVVDSAGGVRMRAQMALRDWMLTLSGTQPLVLLFDGLERADEETLAFVVSLALELRGSALLLVSSLVSSGTRRPLEDALCRASHQLALAPFSAATSFELLRSVFGSDDRVPRLAQRLDEKAHGNPGHLLELCRQLVRKNQIKFASGAWAVPHELLEGQLASTHGGALRARLALLEPAERAVACALSLHEGEISAELESHLLTGAQVAPLARVEALANLLDQGVLVRGEHGLRFAHEEQRALLNTQLVEPTRSVLAHRLGEYLLAQPQAPAEERIRAGVQLLNAGDPRALSVLQEAGAQLAKARAQLSASLLRELEHALATLRARGVPERALVGLLVPLALGAFATDTRSTLRHGPAAVHALSELLGLPRAHGWQRALGARAAMTMSLASAKRELRGKALDYSTAFGLLVACASGLAATACEVLDPPLALTYAEAIAPLAVLGPDHLASIAYEYCRALVASSRDDLVAARSSWQTLLARLDDARPIRHMPAPMRARYQSGALYALGLLQAREEDPQALHSADRIEQAGLPMHAMRGEEVRALYHGFRGDNALWELGRARAEHHAAQHGASFRFEVWDALSASELSALARDAMGLKRAYERLNKLSEDFPSLRPHQERCRAGYLALHGRFREAIALLAPRAEAEPLAHAGWLPASVQLARIHNRLGEFVEARTVCERVLAGMRCVDARSAQHAPLLAEHAVALAGAGELGAARAVLAQLVEASQDKGPLRRACVAETEVQLALLAGEPELVETALHEFERLAQQTGLLTLMQQARAFSTRVHAPNARLAVLTAGGPQLEGTWSRVERTLGGSLTLTQRCERALEMLVTRAAVTRGQLFLLAGGDALACCAALGEPPPADVEDWMRARLLEEFEDDATELVLEEDAGPDLPDVMPSGDELVRMLPLSAPSSDGHGVVGAVLLFARGKAPGVPPDLLTAIAVHLSRAVMPGRQRA
jgi:hypothetical protein